MPPDTHFAPNSWEARDLRSMLHGFSHLGTLRQSGPVVISRGDGVYVERITANVLKRFVDEEPF